MKFLICRAGKSSSQTMWSTTQAGRLARLVQLVRVRSFSSQPSDVHDGMLFPFLCLSHTLLAAGASLKKLLRGAKEHRELITMGSTMFGLVLVGGYFIGRYVTSMQADNRILQETVKLEIKRVQEVEAANSKWELALWGGILSNEGIDIKKKSEEQQ